ncbi:hypothetical protein [Streptomyces sp. WM6378]|uniref:hypothetical protein n=1 Tax=Streptomyces sp. WM6378 TaxID=1415557 RepID=UPI000A860FB9|nr:hypothetical protein [Streptomyces sp. WM6378]
MPATVIGQGIVHLCRHEGTKSVDARTSDDFPPDFEVVADDRTSPTIRIRYEN